MIPRQRGTKQEYALSLHVHSHRFAYQPLPSPSLSHCIGTAGRSPYPAVPGLRHALLVRVGWYAPAAAIRDHRHGQPLHRLPVHWMLPGAAAYHPYSDTPAAHHLWPPPHVYPLPRPRQCGQHTDNYWDMKNSSTMSIPKCNGQVRHPGSTGCGPLPGPPTPSPMRRRHLQRTGTPPLAPTTPARALPRTPSHTFTVMFVTPASYHTHQCDPHACPPYIHGHVPPSTPNATLTHAPHTFTAMFLLSHPPMRPSRMPPTHSRPCSS